MPRINPWAYPRKPARVVPVPFPAPNDPATECTIYLREPGFDAQLLADEAAAELMEQWSAGFAAPDGTPVQVSRAFCRTVARIEQAQCAADGSDLPPDSPERYDAVGITGFLLALPAVGGRLVAAYNDLVISGTEAEKNSSPAPGGA